MPLSEVEERGFMSGLTEYHSNVAADGNIQAEVSGKRLMLVEFTLAETGGISSVTVTVRKKDGSGDILYALTIAAGGSIHVSLKVWRKGDAYDESAAGGIYLVKTGTGTLSADWLIIGK